ncbi:alpha/beta fold hydrolase [Chengkuizengella axinellae]|uniref:Alpha/beta hydrolase n=1 Tax=Chengkuizengella axinellae TaxID=3064388 RepID=A0ABT9J275_9BACL|nr:alpha/beta hydrolase [Chengkuizengella sp. 2205SS18-9]MDP5275708.1 alpha/beta hydrolase [Chengkuizengella sp. 2205SS18-9]
MLHHTVHKHKFSKDWIVFLHGIGGGSATWYKQIAAFRKEFNLVLIDFRGHGGSTDVKPELSAYHFKDIAKEVIEVLNTLNIKKAHFVGLSFGTLVMYVLNNIASDRISSMVLGGAITRVTKFGRVLFELGNACKNMVPYMWLYKLAAYILMPKKNHRNSRNVFVKQASMLGKSEFLKWFKLCKQTNKIYPSMDTTIQIPKLYIMGSEDHMFINSTLKDTSNDTNRTVHIIDNSGHVCNIDNYREFNKVAIEYLNEQIMSNPFELHKSSSSF